MITYKQLKEYADKGLTSKQTAEILNVHYSSVRKWANRWGIVFEKRPPKITFEQMKECADKGLTKKQTSEYLGVSYATVFKYDKKYKLFGNERGAPVEKIKECAEKGLTMEETAKLLNLCYHTVVRHQKTNNIPFKVEKPKVTYEQLRKCAEKGLTMKETAELLNVSYITVVRHKKIHGIPFKSGKSKFVWEIEPESKRTILFIDLDGVVVEFLPLFLEFLKTKGIYLKPEDINKYSFLEDCASPEQIEKWLIEFFNSYPDLPEVPGAVEAIKELAQEYEIRFLTARPLKAGKVTVEWLKNKGLNYSIAFDGIYKERIVKKYANSIIIEDRPETALKLAEANKKVLLFDRSYNRDIPEHPCIKRVFSWQEISQELHSL